MTPCDFCPTVDGVRPVAVLRCWLITYRNTETNEQRARRFCLCEQCWTEAVAHGDAVPGAVVEVL